MLGRVESTLTEEESLEASTQEPWERSSELKAQAPGRARQALVNMTRRGHRPYRPSVLLAGVRTLLQCKRSGHRKPGHLRVFTLGQGEGRGMLGSSPPSRPDTSQKSLGGEAGRIRRLLKVF